MQICSIHTHKRICQIINNLNNELMIIAVKVNTITQHSQNKIYKLNFKLFKILQILCLRTFP